MSVVLFVKNINILKVASELVVVQAETHDEVVRNLHRDIVKDDILFVCIRLQEKGAYALL